MQRNSDLNLSVRAGATSVCGGRNLFTESYLLVSPFHGCVAKLLGKVPTTSDMAALNTRVDFSWEDVYECVRMDNSSLLRLPYFSIANLNHHSGAVPAALTA